MTHPTVEAVHLSTEHTFSKQPRAQITLVTGIGILGDAHAGITVQHRSRVAVDPTQPNLRQVHLLHAELHEALAQRGFRVAAGEMGENITTRGLDLLSLPTDTVLHIGAGVALKITGLRNPCAQIDAFQTGLLAAVLDRDADGALIRKAGVMAVVLSGGEVQPGDLIRVQLPPQPHRPLERV